MYKDLWLVKEYQENLTNLQISQIWKGLKNSLFNSCDIIVIQLSVT